RCERADRHPNQNRLRAVAGQIDRSSGHTVHLRLILPQSLQQTRRRRRHHNNRTHEIPQDPESMNPDGLPHTIVDTPEQAVRVEPLNPDRQPREPVRAPALPLDRTAQALHKWDVQQSWRYARLQGAVQVSADLFGPPPAQPTSAHEPTDLIASEAP